MSSCRPRPACEEQACALCTVRACKSHKPWSRNGFRGALPCLAVTYDPSRARVFRYDSWEWHEPPRRLRCQYRLDDLAFEETITFDGPPPGAGPVDEAASAAAARLVFLLAGVSYYKVAAPPVIDLGGESLTPAGARLLRAFYVDGLAEYAYRNGVDLTDVRIEARGSDRLPAAPRSDPAPDRALVPFGGGIDSIVTVEGVRAAGIDAALFVVSREGDRFEAIEAAAAVTGLPVVRAERGLDPKVLRSAELGYRNGHVPVTGVISAIAVMAAVLDGRGAVVMSNEWSASAGTVEHDGRTVNHQWSKSADFEALLRAALAETFAAPVDYFSWLRPFSELWVAQRFAALPRYFGAFRSCNRAFPVNPMDRLDRWCGRCDKCCFVDLILAPFVAADDLRAVFDGAEPLDDPGLLERFRALVGMAGSTKPFECVGDVEECRVAVMVAAERADRDGGPVLATLRPEVAHLVPGNLKVRLERLLRPLGGHAVPASYAPPDLLG